jgi:hypothetical protein
MSAISERWSCVMVFLGSGCLRNLSCPLVCRSYSLKQWLYRWFELWCAGGYQNMSVNVSRVWSISLSWHFTAVYRFVVIDVIEGCIVDILKCFFWLRRVIIWSWNDTGRKDCVRLIASTRALNSYVIKFIIKLKMAYIWEILPIIQFRLLCRSGFYLNT